MNRTPLAKIRRLLRREVGFGCLVEGCGSPYLTYHHFDPPWARRHHHELKGMLALCLQHHKEADAGAFTDSQLRQLKKRKSKSLIRGHFNRDSPDGFADDSSTMGIRLRIRLSCHDRLWFALDRADLAMRNPAPHASGQCRILAHSGITLMRRSTSGIGSEADLGNRCFQCEVPGPHRCALRGAQDEDSSGFIPRWM